MYSFKWWMRVGGAALLFPLVFAVAGGIALIVWANNLDVDYVLRQRGYSTFVVTLTLYAVSAGLAGLITAAAAGVRRWWVLGTALVAGTVNAAMFAIVEPLHDGAMDERYWLVAWLVSTAVIILTVLVVPKDQPHATTSHTAHLAGT